MIYVLLLYLENDSLFLYPYIFDFVVLKGDELDSSLAATEEVWHSALHRETAYPGLALYVGGHSNHLNGAFAGIAQIQVYLECIYLLPY
jgi:hypothetical protein